MYQEFDCLKDLFEELRRDKRAEGANASTRNRYPVRFILLEEFSSLRAFVSRVTTMPEAVRIQDVVGWIDESNPDRTLTTKEIRDKIAYYISDTSDSVIVPFSELVRFYAREDFVALVRDLKLIQAEQEGFEHHRRVYIPLIGLYSWMALFLRDAECVCWGLRQPTERRNYQVILTSETYEVRGLDRRYTIVDSFSAWLKVWSVEECHSKIIVQSKSINRLSENAQSDNAITYIRCSNVNEFLTEGLGLDISLIPYRPKEDGYWRDLAQRININEEFTLDAFVNDYFGVNSLNNYRRFIELWLQTEDPFSRWLLISYYLARAGRPGYLTDILSTQSYRAPQSLVSALVLRVFEAENSENYLEERSEIIRIVKQCGVNPNNKVEQEVRRKLKEFAERFGYQTALRYNEGFARSEKELLIEWLGHGHISKSDVEEIFPELYSYMGHWKLSEDTSIQWIWDYMDLYKQCKIANSYSSEVQSIISDKNQSSASFNTWYNSFCTTRTVLANRTDIEVFYWIDGLGVDWIPFIIKQIDNLNGNGIYLNEVLVARSLLPTTTEINKVDLQQLAGAGLEKEGDLDDFAHKCTPYPQYLVEEMERVASAIKTIAEKYVGQKVAIISDHGISYLSQFCKGYRLGGVETNHHGRCGSRILPQTIGDGRFIVLKNDHTICALKHESLENKVSVGQGVHGGCTPEEVLVPIIILSPHERAIEYETNLITTEVLGNNPVVRFSIKGLSNIDVPRVVYNTRSYGLTSLGDNVYETLLSPSDLKSTKIEVCIGNDYRKEFNIQVNSGAEEDDDLFSF